MAQKSICFTQLFFAAGFELVHRGVRQAADMAKGDPGNICIFCGSRMLNQLKMPCISVTMRTLKSCITAKITSAWLNCLESSYGWSTNFYRRTISSVALSSFCLPKALIFHIQEAQILLVMVLAKTGMTVWKSRRMKKN